MLTSTHSLAGAAAGKYIPNPFLAFLVGILLHFVFDKIPHFWPLQEKYKTYIIIADTAGTIIIISALLLSHLSNKSGIISGALGGAAVDFFLVLLPLTNKNKLAEWHSKRQIHLKDVKFILNDVLIMVVLIVILIFFP